MVVLVLGYALDQQGPVKYVWGKADPMLKVDIRHCVFKQMFN